ncbi:MAG TPA: hypothetical protein PKE65_03800 [Rhizobiaceae bacterium]|nr:hypothetical protein [Rhizobiaceae bacterium]
MRFGRDGKTVERRRQSDPAPSPGSQPAAPSFNPRAVMQRELQQGETLIWADQPKNRGAHAKKKIGISIFGIPFLAFALFWTAAASGFLFDGEGPPGLIGIIFPLFGLPFIFAGLGMVLSPLWALRKAGRTFYALTDRRVVIAESGKTWTARSWALDDLGQLERTERADGTGDVVFAKTWVRGAKGGGHNEHHGFYGIAEPARVEQAIRQAREKKAD